MWGDMKGLKLQSVDVLALALKDAKVRYEKEYGFDPERKWRADIAIVGKKVILEIHGGVWSGGRHTRGGGFLDDREKMNRAQELGWITLEYDTKQAQDLSCMPQIMRVLAGRKTT